MSGKQFGYSKFRNESGSLERETGSVKLASTPHETLHTERSWPTMASHTKVHKKDSSEPPLIDLSDESELTSSASQASRQASASEISSLFDSLCSNSPPQYGGMDQPLIKATGQVPDPFEINHNVIYARTAKQTESADTKKKTPPPRPKPIVYRRTTSVESQNSDSVQSFSPPKVSGFKNIPQEYRRRDTSDSGSVHSTHSAPERRQSPVRSSEYSTSPQRPQQTKAVLEELFARGQKTAKHHSLPGPIPPRLNSPHSPGHKLFIEQPKTVDKAFDWLNDAISNFSLAKSCKSGSDPSLRLNSLPQYDQVPDETGTTQSPPVRPKLYSPADPKCSYPVQYCQVPDEGTSQRNNGYQDNNMPKYDEVPQFDDPNDVKLPIPKDIYSPQSTTSTYSEWEDDDFDSEFDDDEVLEETIKGAGSSDRNSPPPLPPRDYTRGDYSQHSSSPKDDPDRKPHIFPILQDGQQLSHTHYFLIPAKGEEDMSGRPEKNTAAVRPFSIDGNQLLSQNKQSYVDYQNIDQTSQSLSHDRTSSNSHSAEDLHHYRPAHSSGGSWTSGIVDVSQSYPNRQVKYKRSHSHAPDSGRSLTSDHSKIHKLQEAVIGLTDEECHAALCHCNGNVERAVKHLKTEQLFRLGLAPRDHCYRLLEALHWNLELASSVMLDGFKAKSSNVSLESTV